MSVLSGGRMIKKSSTLGSLIRMVRQKHGWSLRTMSAKVGIPVSTLGKVESDKLSLTYEKLQQLSSRLGMTVTEFLAQAETTPAASAPRPITARRSMTGPHNSVEISTPNYIYRYLCTDLSGKRMVPMIGRVRARSAEEFGEFSRHRGEEFIFVLEGTIEVHTQFYTPVTLITGQGIYLDSSMGHAYTAKDCESALALLVCSDEGVDLSEDLIGLAESEADRS
jgi:transcriptional regulator with XRE-family HTH domain